MEKRTILIQIDSDKHPSTFDRVVAIDSGVDQLFSYGNITPDDVQALIHGAIFTRGPKDLHKTAIFIGGSNVQDAEQLLKEARKHMIPDYGLQVSILFDANGCNTTAAAAVHAAASHLSLKDTQALVLGGTGPVGQRVAHLLAGQGASTRLASRKLDRAKQATNAIREKVENANLQPMQVSNEQELLDAINGQELVIAAGAAGVELLPASVREQCSTLKVAIDLNAVPPVGLGGVEVSDKAVERNGVLCYGAIGVGGTKMKIHRAAIAKLFESNAQILDAEEVFSIAQSL